MMDITKAVEHHYPDLKAGVNFIVSTDAYGEQTLTYWDNGTGKPLPSKDDLNQWWLDYLKAQRKAEITNACEATLSGGFSYTAVGKAFAVDAQSWALILGEYAFLQANADATPQVLTAADGSAVTLTRDQFFALVAGARDFVGQNRQKERDLHAQIDAAKTEDDIQAIQWTN